TRDEQLPAATEFAETIVGRFRAGWPEPVQVVLEPGRSLVGRAGVTLYRIGARKRSGGIDYVTIDGGMSDNPRPQLYEARYEARRRAQSGVLRRRVPRVREGGSSERGLTALDRRIRVQRRPLPGRSTVRPDQLFHRLGPQLLPELGAGRAGDRLVHQRAAEIV